MSLMIARNLVTSARLCAGAKVRLARGEARSGNEYGPLTDLPDWSYAGACMFYTHLHLQCVRLAHITPDGREAPVSRKQKKRYTQQGLAFVCVLGFTHDYSSFHRLYSRRTESARCCSR